MDENDSCTHLLFRLISFPDDSCQRASLRIAMSQVDDVDAELRLLHVQYLIVFTKWWLCGTYGIAKCSSNVHFLIHLYTLTERSSSVWSMSPLSSPSRMETAPGFSPCRLAMPHCGRSCLVLNFPVNKWNQHPSARAGRCRAMTSQRTF